MAIEDVRAFGRGEPTEMAVERPFEEASIEELNHVVSSLNNDISNLHSQRFKVERILRNKMEQQEKAFHIQREAYLAIINPPETNSDEPTAEPMARVPEFDRWSR